MAEGEGFEPPGPCGPLVFKTSAIDHSTTPPLRCFACRAQVYRLDVCGVQGNLCLSMEGFQVVWLWLGLEIQVDFGAAVGAAAFRVVFAGFGDVWAARLGGTFCDGDDLVG